LNYAAVVILQVPPHSREKILNILPNNFANEGEKHLIDHSKFIAPKEDG